MRETNGAVVSHWRKDEPLYQEWQNKVWEFMDMDVKPRTPPLTTAEAIVISSIAFAIAWMWHSR